VLSDNGMVFTTRYAGGRGGRNAFETELHRLGIAKKNSRPNHPQTCGKVERLHQTLKQWLRAQPAQPTTLEDLQSLLSAFTDSYNTRRPHRSLHRRTPQAAYTTRAKAQPAGSNKPAHDRVRRDRVDASGVVTVRHNGRLHHIGLGRTHARTSVLLLIHDLDIRIIDATTGELLRHLTLNPDRDYQPQKQRQPEP